MVDAGTNLAVLNLDTVTLLYRLELGLCLGSAVRPLAFVFCIRYVDVEDSAAVVVHGGSFLGTMWTEESANDDAKTMVLGA